MDSILNYSENDFPSLGSSARGRSRKRNKFPSSVVNQNSGVNQFMKQSHQSSFLERSIEIPSTVDSSQDQHEEICQKLNVSRKPKPTLSVHINDFLMVVFYLDPFLDSLLFLDDNFIIIFFFTELEETLSKNSCTS